MVICQRPFAMRTESFSSYDWCWENIALLQAGGYPSETATRNIILILAKRLVQQLTVILEQQRSGYL